MKRVHIVILALWFLLSLSSCIHETNQQDGSDNNAPDTMPANLTKVVVEPQYKPSMGFSFGLPEGWAYEIIYSDEEPESTSAIVRPETVEAGREIIIQYSRSFGVCGTGLRMEQIDFNGHEAAMGFYDGSPLWSFIVLSGEYKNCVILNFGHNWYEEHEDEIDLLLCSVKFTYYE